MSMLRSFVPLATHVTSTASAYPVAALELFLPNYIRTPSLPQILPMENVNGRKLVESGNLCERKNGRGVDPNRNWDAHWGFKEADYDPAEEYPGAAAFR